MDSASPRTVHVSCAPTCAPTTGVEHVPSVTFAAEPHSIGGGDAYRTTYRAGCASPLSTSVNASVAEVAATVAMLRFVTVPGACTGALVVPCAVFDRSPKTAS